MKNERTCSGRPIKILLSGPGLIGRKHAELIACSERSTLAAIVAPPTDCNLSFASKQDVPLFTSVEDALGRVLIDAAIIASPNKFHAEQTLLCIGRGVPVLVEKPLAADLRSAASICREAKIRNVPVLVGHHRTYSPLLSAAKDFIRSERFGDLVAVQGSALFRKPEHYFEEGPWRASFGGGPILINLIHDIGTLRFLCGPISAVSATASHARRRFEVEDTVAMAIRFEQGALGTFLLSDIAASNQSWEMTSAENPAYPHSADAACYHLVGTNGSLDFPTLQGRFYGFDDLPSWWNPFQTMRLTVEKADPLKEQLRHFEAVVDGRAKPLVSPDEGLENMRVLEAIRRAIATRQTVELSTVHPDDSPVCV